MILVDNVLFLKKNFPECWELVKSIEEGENDSVKIETCKAGGSTLSVKTENGWNYIHSKYDPKAEAERLIANYPNIKDFKHVFFYGIGFGYHIEEFTERYPQKSFSVYEPNSRIFHALLSTKLLERWNPKKMKNVYTGGSKELFNFNLSHFVETVNEEVLLIVLPSYERIFKDQTNDFIAEFRNAVYNKGAAITANTIFSKRNTINSIINLPTTLQTPNLLHERPEDFKGKPAILVAAGPSLDFEYDNLRYIKENGLAYIFSVGSAINSLIDQGIYPDAACTYDGSEKNQMVFQKVVEKHIHQIPLVYGSSVGYETIQNYPGTLVNFLVARDYLAAFCLKRQDGQPLEFISAARSIAIITLQLLYKLGCNPIILVGQNFAFLDNRSYSQGMQFNIELSEKAMANAIVVKDVEGNEIYSDRGLDTFRREMEHFIRLFRDAEIINTTRGGANIQGTTYIPLEQVIQKRLTLKNIVSDQWVSKMECLYDYDYLREQFHLLHVEQEKCEHIFKMFFDLLDQMDHYIHSRNKKQLRKAFDKFDKLFDKLQSNIFYKILLQPMNTLKFESIMKMFEEVRFIDEFDKAKRVIYEFTQYLNLCQSDIKTLNPLLDKTFNEIFKTSHV